MIRIELPFPPSVNNLYINAGKRRVMSARYKAWFALACVSVKDTHRQNIGPYALNICVKRPDKRRRDLGNLEKAVSDLLVECGVIRDDSLCERITLQWDAGIQAECVVIVIPCPEAIAA